MVAVVSEFLSCLEVGRLRALLMKLPCETVRNIGNFNLVIRVAVSSMCSERWAAPLKLSAGLTSIFDGWMLVLMVSVVLVVNLLRIDVMMVLGLLLQDTVMGLACGGSLLAREMMHFVLSVVVYVVNLGLVLVYALPMRLTLVVV